MNDVIINIVFKEYQNGDLIIYMPVDSHFVCVIVSNIKFYLIIHKH